MKTKLFTVLIMLFLISGSTYAQRGDLILSFSGKDIETNTPVPLESVFINNITKGCDTTLYGETPFLYLLWPSGINDNIIGNNVSFSLQPNYPNPFSGNTRFKIELTNKENLRLLLSNINGVVISVFEIELNRGLHTFEIEIGKNSMCFLSVSNGEITRSIKLLSNTTEVSTSQNITYIGSENNIVYKSTEDTESFLFTPGDQLLLKASAIGYHDNTLYDNPNENTNYVFELQQETVITFPTVTTTGLTDITQNSATSGGNVTDDGNDDVTSRGVCWSTSQNPTISDDHTINGDGTGVFTSYLTGLTENTTYYVRAYATNSVGTSYGNELSFIISEVATISGYVFYAGTEIPVSGVMISIDSFNASTGSDGYYEVINIAVGTQTLFAEKDGYDTYSTTLQLMPGINIFNIEMTSAAYTHNIYGVVTSASTGNPISGAIVALLNPDGTSSSLATETDINGYYQIPTVPQGQREISFTHFYFETFIANLFIANSNYNYDCQLTVNHYGFEGTYTEDFICELEYSPYYVVGTTNFIDDAKLIIEPGVEVIFDGDYTLSAIYEAVGNSNYPIYFHSEIYQQGEIFLEHLSTFEHCNISNLDKAIKNDKYGNIYSINNINISDCGVGIQLEEEAIIENCIISDCSFGIKLSESCSDKEEQQFINFEISGCDVAIHVDANTDWSYQDFKLIDSHLTNNITGIDFDHGRSRVIITNCEISNNENRGLDMEISSSWGSQHSISIDIINSYINNNSTGVYIKGNGMNYGFHIELIDCEINNNELGIYYFKHEVAQKGILEIARILDIDNCNVRYNEIGVEYNDNYSPELSTIHGSSNIMDNTIYNASNLTTLTQYYFRMKNNFWGDDPPNENLFNGEILYTPYETTEIVDAGPDW